MSDAKKLALGAGVLMLAFYLTKRKAPASNVGRPGYFFDGYGWVSNHGTYL